MNSLVWQKVKGAMISPGVLVIIIAVAIVWAAVILAVSLVLEGTPYASRVLLLMGGGAAATIILLGGLRRKV